MSAADLERDLTDAQRKALRNRQFDIEANKAGGAVFARGVTTAALRRRGLIAGAMPHANITKLGEEVVRLIDPDTAA